MSIQAGQLPEEVWWIPHAMSQVAQKSKFQYLIYPQITFMPTGWLRIFTHIMPINIYQSDFDCILITFVWVKENATGENDSSSKHVCMQHVHHDVFTSAAIQEPSDEMESEMKCPLERLHVNMYGPLNTMASCPWVYLPNYDPNRLVHDFGRTKYPQTWFFPFFTKLCQSIEKNLKIANEIHLDRYQSLQLARVAKWYLNTLLCSNRSELTYVNGWQLVKMKKSIPDMSLPWNL